VQVLQSCKEMLKVRLTIKKSQLTSDGNFWLTHFGERKEISYRKIEYQAATWDSAIKSFNFDEIQEMSIVDLTEEFYDKNYGGYQPIEK
jgi:hypothetical protein